ncbi:hypothetical protein [Anaeroselena agilis]|uniref:Uncharacterized protein n=1 Tax=Anaeroselena agilis TaxID=3063788 RepID=A0ABU3NVV8_9FIRM|nr:hypothetical protein [Selenomonadales bacterium 4137-cl]
MKTLYVQVDINSYNGKLYDFKTDIADLQKGDVVVVDTINGMLIGKVVGYTDDTKATKWVIDKVDTTAHKARLERDKQLAALRKKLEARRKAVDELTAFRHLASMDSEAAALLTQYEALIQ